MVAQCWQSCAVPNINSSAGTACSLESPCPGPTPAVLRRRRCGCRRWLVLRGQSRAGQLTRTGHEIGRPALSLNQTGLRLLSLRRPPTDASAPGAPAGQSAHLQPAARSGPATADRSGPVTAARSGPVTAARSGPGRPTDQGHQNRWCRLAVVSGSRCCLWSPVVSVPVPYVETLA